MEKISSFIIFILYSSLCFKLFSAHSLSKREADPFLDIPGKIRPFCTALVGTVQRAPQICNKVGDFIVDATVTACRESIDQILKQCTGQNCVSGIGGMLCPKRKTIERNMKPVIVRNCKNSIQKLLDSSGRFVTNIGTDAICNAFINAVRDTCLVSVAHYCENMTFPFRYPCETYFPLLICNPYQ